jgi:hypothetical protein
MIEATQWCYSDILVFLDDKGQVVGYEPDMTSRSMQAFNLPLPKLYPKGTAKTLLLKIIRVKLSYQKAKIDDVKGEITYWEVTDNILREINYHLTDATEVDPKLVEEGTCIGYSSITGEIGMHASCENCVNSVFCNDSRHGETLLL